MRIYISRKLPKIPEDSNLIKYSTKYKEIYSEEGIFRVQNDKLFQLLPEDKVIESFSLNNLEFMIDTGGMTQKKTVQTLPFNHITRDIEQIEYRLHNKSVVVLIILYNKSILVNEYFFVKKDSICNIVKNEILEYIELLDIK